MSLQRFQRGVRQMGIGSGTSRLARPPQVLPEADIRPPLGGPLGTYRIYALGQTLSAGSNVGILFDVTTETNDGDIDVAYEDLFGTDTVTIHDAGTYSAFLHAEFTGTVTQNHATLSGFDNATADWSTGQIGPGTPIEIESGDSGAPPGYGTTDGRFVYTTEGWVFPFSGPGAGVSGVQVTAETYLEVYRWA